MVEPPKEIKYPLSARARKGPESRIIFPLGREGKIFFLLPPISDTAGIASGRTRIPHFSSPSVGARQSLEGSGVPFVIGFISKIDANANIVIKTNNKRYLHGMTLPDRGNGNNHYKKKLSRIQTMTTDCAARGSQLTKRSGSFLNYGNVSICDESSPARRSIIGGIR